MRDTSAKSTLATSTPPAPLLLDITRLIWRTPRSGPSGIDRIELEYARHFLAADAPRPAYGVINLYGWLLAISPAGGRRFVRDLSQRWQGGVAGTASSAQHIRSPWFIYLRLLTSAWSSSAWLRFKLRRHGGTPVFLVVSHHHLSRDSIMPRIRRAFGARCVCYLHDLIPLEYPEFFRPGWESRGQRLCRNAARHFDAVIVNSAVTAQSFEHWRSTHPEDAPEAAPKNALELPQVEGNRIRASVHIALPGIRPFAPPPPPAFPTGATALPYFVVLGTIEPRKNHLLLLNLWARLAASMERPPLLLLMGARGWENEQVVDMLERCRQLRGLVLEYNRLDDAEVAQRLHGARALLLPSFVEGFGLPLAEALASGVPVICSDIPVFREVGADVPEYLDAQDHFAWRQAVTDYCEPDSPRRAAQLQRLGLWRAPSWEQHFKTVELALCAVATC